jgi:hypothetical protein
MPCACTRRPIQIAFWCLLLVTLVVQPLFAQVPPSADTFVSSSTPKTNYGPAIALVVGQGSTSYVRFNIAGVPAGSSISKATLRLYVDAVAKAGTFDVYQLNSSWAENTLTYNTPPPPLGLSVTNGTGVSITTASWNQFLLIDITALAQGWVNGTIPNNGVALALTSGSSGSFSFDSKESLLTGNGPELEIAFNSGTGPQGPAGPTGPQGPQGTTGAVGPTGATGATGSQGATGLQGAPGPLGPMGLTGAQGLQGVAGPQGAAGTGFNFRAAFDNTASYAANDVVSYNGSSYVAKNATNPGDPAPDSNPNWSLMAQQGAAGATGATGASGPIGLTGVTGAAGAQGPQGLTGATGPAGTQGPQGIPGLTGSTGAQGPQGVNGAQGPQGPQGTAGTGFNWRGAFDCSASYSAGDVISYQGSSWITNTPIGGCVQPPFSPWALLAQQGAAGPAGGGGQGLAEIRAALLQWYPTMYGVGSNPNEVAFDGTNIWVVNGAGNSVTKLLASTGAVVGTYAVGNQPNGIAFDGANIWVANNASDNVTELLASSGAVVGTYVVGRRPRGIAFDGTNIWVANQGDSSVTKLLASTGVVVGTYVVVDGGDPAGVAFDGTNIWVVNNALDSVTKLLASTGAVVGTYTVGFTPNGPPIEGVAFDGTNIWVANHSGSVIKLLASTGAVVGTYAVSDPIGIAFDGTNIWVANQSGSVTKLLASTGAVVGTYAVGAAPFGLAFDGTNIWVANGGDNSVTKIGATR